MGNQAQTDVTKMLEYVTRLTAAFHRPSDSPSDINSRQGDLSLEEGKYTKVQSLASPY